MILNDSDIHALCASHQLLADYDPQHVRNCAYVLRASRVFRPETGEEEVLGALQGSGKQVVWEIGPSETLVIRTRERVKVPADTCAIYAPLFRLAKQGIMLLNASIVEPGYEGPLSCFLANFSAQRVTLRQDGPIAKILFQKLTDPPAALKPEVVEEKSYQEDLAEYAKRFHRSFMDVTGIEARAAERAKKELRGWVVGGGLLIAFLLIWASIEPLLSKWVWEKHGIMSTTQRVEDVKLLKDLEATQSTVKSLLERRQAEEELRMQVRTLQAEVDTLKQRIGAKR